MPTRLIEETIAEPIAREIIFNTNTPTPLQTQLNLPLLTITNTFLYM